jgi:uncharacterized protein (AIM24 family)
VFVIPNKVAGTSMQHITCQVSEGQTIYAEPGKFLWKTHNVALQTRLSTPAAVQGQGKSGFIEAAMNMGKRTLAGEHLAFEYFTASGNGLVGFAGAVPGEIKVLELDGPGWITQKGALVAAESTVNFNIAFSGLRSGLRGGEGFILENFTGVGTLVLAAAGNFVELNPASYGGTIHVHTGCLVAFSDTLQYSVARMGGLGTQMLMNAVLGDGSMVATITGDGTVLIQSMTIRALAELIAQHETRGGGEEHKTGLTDLF